MAIGVADEDAIANISAEILRWRRQAALALGHGSQEVDLLATRDADAEVAKRTEWAFNLRHFEQDDHERPGTVAQPVRAPVAEYDPHPRVVPIKLDALLNIRHW